MSSVTSSGAPGRVALLCLLLLLGACAGITPGVAPKLDGVKRIGVISAMGDTFYLQKVGRTVFGNERNEFPAAAWGIDDLMVSKVRATLGRRFDIRPVTYQRAAFYASNPGGIGARVRAAAPSGGVDAYVVLTRGVSQVGATNQYVNGLGLLEASGGILYANTYFVYAIYAVDLVDANAFSSMGAAISLMPGESLVDPLRTTALRGPHRQVDQSWWPTSLDAASNQRLKGAVVQLIDASLANTLQQLELAN
jgi:hypothetical protein